MTHDKPEPGIFNGGPLDGQAAPFFGWKLAVPIIECGAIVSHLYEWREFMGIRDNCAGSDGFYAYFGREYDTQPTTRSPAGM